MTVAVAAHNLSKIYGEGAEMVQAVDDVSLAVHEGEFVALVGPSGSGKTTMLAMLAGLLKPTAGSITIEGRDLAQLSESELTRFRREHVGFTFQSNNLVPYLTAKDNVELMLRLNHKSLKNGVVKSEVLLDRLGLGQRLHHYPNQLSGGQQQRVAIARALIHEPTLVLADEPTASLDSTMAHQVVRTFAELIHEQNRTGIMVTHDLRMCKYVDRVIMMQDGRIARILTERAEIDALAAASEQH